jgi:hypothetical protein
VRRSSFCRVVRCSLQCADSGAAGLLPGTVLEERSVRSIPALRGGSDQSFRSIVVMTSSFCVSERPVAESDRT